MNALKQPPILIVEDSEDDHEALLRAFRHAGLAAPTHWCRSGEDAIDFLKGVGDYARSGTERPALVLLDLNMPGMDGRRTLEVIKSDEALKGIPVIILTTSGNARDVESCYQAGANSYIRKPISFDELIHAITRLKDYWFGAALVPATAVDRPPA